MDNEKLKRYFYKCLLIRKTERKIEELFNEGKLRGTTHGYVGQEIIAVSLLDKVNIKNDYVTGTHRSHGHYLALFEDPFGLISELMGKKTGVISGKGGSQHLYRDNFFTNGITGGMIPVGTGMAMAKKFESDGSIVLSFLGDGAMNEGYVFESLNFAKVNDLPILFVLENNQYAMSTSVDNVNAGGFNNRINSLNIKLLTARTIGLENVESVSVEAIQYVRQKRKPCFINFETYRFCGHSKSDKCEYRDKEEENYWLENDVLKMIKETLSENEIILIEKEVDNIIHEAVNEAEKAGLPDPEIIYDREE